jgi:hypothetical protein
MKGIEGIWAATAIALTGTIDRNILYGQLAIIDK